MTSNDIFVTVKFIKHRVLKIERMALYGACKAAYHNPFIYATKLKVLYLDRIDKYIKLELFYMYIYTFEGFGLPPLVELTVLSIESALLRFNVCFDILDDKFEEFFLSFLCVPIKINMID